MKLVALISSLLATSIIPLYFNALGRFSVSLLRLFPENKQQGTKKPNKINACLLVALVAPTGNAVANKRRSPWALSQLANRISEIEKQREAVGQPVRDKLSRSMSAAIAPIPQCQYYHSGGET